MNKRFQDITVGDVAGMPADVIEALVEENYPALERQRMAAAAAIDNFFRDISN